MPRPAIQKLLDSTEALSKQTDEALLSTSFDSTVRTRLIAAHVALVQAEYEFRHAIIEHDKLHPGERI